MIPISPTFSLFFFNDTATTEIYTLSLHDALPISYRLRFDTGAYFAALGVAPFHPFVEIVFEIRDAEQDRKSTRLNSSHSQISYAVFCLKKKKPRIQQLLRHRRQLCRGTPRPSQSR